MESHLKLWKYAKKDARFVRFCSSNIAKLLTIYYYCQSTSVVGTKIKELKDRVYNLSNIIVETFTPNDENGSEEVIMKAAKGIERHIEDLVR